MFSAASAATQRIPPFILPVRSIRRSGRSLCDGAGIFDSFSQQMLEAWQHENVDTSLTQRMENRLRASIIPKPMILASVPSTTGVTKRQRNSGWRASGQRLSAGAGDLRLSLPERRSLSQFLSPTSRDGAAIFIA